MSATTDSGERLARLGGAYEHLATKADIFEIKAELRLLKWMMTIMTIGVLYPLLERLWQ